MSRQIKFRAWDKRNNRFLMEDDWYLHPTKGPSIYWNKLSTFPDDLDLLQYTGLKDKNGKEIYEGDIIKDERSEGQSDIDVIIWQEGSFWLKKAQNLPSVGDFSEWVEVIGTIYENPELLNAS